MTSPQPGKPASWYESNPHAKISFTRLASWRRCPAWYRHQYLDWHRTWSTPVLRVGHVVQAVLEKVFDNVPADDVTLEILEERALARMEVLFPRLWEASGLAYPALLDRLIELALERHRTRSELETVYRRS